MCSGCLCICVCARASRTFLMQHLEKCWIYFHQTLNTDALWGKDEGFKFSGLKVKVQGHCGYNMLEKVA